MSNDLTFNPERYYTGVVDLENNGSNNDRTWVDVTHDGSRKLLDEMKGNLEWFERNIAFLKS